VVVVVDSLEVHDHWRRTSHEEPSLQADTSVEHILHGTTSYTVDWHSTAGSHRQLYFCHYCCYLTYVLHERCENLRLLVNKFSYFMRNLQISQRLERHRLKQVMWPWTRPLKGDLSFLFWDLTACLPVYKI